MSADQYKQKGSCEKCTDCGEMWEKTDKKCPKCGSPYHTKVLSVSDNVSISDMMRGKGSKKPGVKRRPFEFKAGVEHQRKLKKQVYRYYKTDREHDCYSEMVIDLETGATIHQCDEALSDHRGHGNAKKENNTKCDVQGKDK